MPGHPFHRVSSRVNSSASLKTQLGNLVLWEYKLRCLCLQVTEGLLGHATRRPERKSFWVNSASSWMSNKTQCHLLIMKTRGRKIGWFFPREFVFLIQWGKCSPGALLPTHPRWLPFTSKWPEWIDPLSRVLPSSKLIGNVRDRKTGRQEAGLDDLYSFILILHF